MTEELFCSSTHKNAEEKVMIQLDLGHMYMYVSYFYESDPYVCVPVNQMIDLYTSNQYP